MSLGGGITKKEENNIVSTQISERTEGEDTGPLFQFLFIEGGGRKICGVAVDDGARFCMSLADNYNKVSYTW